MVSNDDGNAIMSTGLHEIHNKQYIKIHFLIALKKTRFTNNAQNSFTMARIEKSGRLL